MVALGATLLTAGVVAAVAGGGGIPGGAVAAVGGDAIDRSAFDHWLGVAVRSGGRPDAAVPRPPDFEACVAQKREAQDDSAKGEARTTDAQRKEECRREYTDLRDRAMQLLISQLWIEGEAEELDISVSDAQVDKAFDEQRKRSFPKDADYKKWLSTSGQSEADIRSRVRADLLQTRIRERVSEDDGKVTEREITDYYAQHKARFGQPARRDVRLVLTETRGKAVAAKRALRRGASWRTVAQRHSIDRASKQQGGKLVNVAEGDQEPGLDEALFEAPVGELRGPVQTQFGWYVFEVLKRKKGLQQTLEQAKGTIKQLVISERRQKDLTEYAERFRKKWRARTECREGYVTQDCENAAEPTPAPTMRQP